MAFQGVGKPKLFLINVKQSLSDHFVQGGIMVEYKHQVEHCFINTFSSFKFQTYLSACKMEKIDITCHDCVFCGIRYALKEVLHQRLYMKEFVIPVMS